MRPHLVHPNRHPHCAGVGPAYRFKYNRLSDMYRHVLAGLFLPLKFSVHVWGSNTWFLGLTRVRTPNGISIGSAVFARFMVVTDRLTDSPRYSVCSDRPYLASAAMRPTNNECSSKSRRKHMKLVVKQSRVDQFLHDLRTRPHPSSGHT